MTDTSMSGHDDRSHSRLSPSGAHRWMTCTASAALEAQFPDEQSPYAAEGTLAHELCELKLRSHFEVMPKSERTKRLNKIKADEQYKTEMDTHSETYLEGIKGITLSLPSKPFIVIEQSLDLSGWIPESRGIADCILIHGDTLWVIDFKYGKGVAVSAEHNPQLMLYALGALQMYSMCYAIKTVKLVIIQPRIADAPSEWEISVDDLYAFGATVSEAAVKARNGEGVFAPSDEACRFCKARATCRARSEHNVRMAFPDTDDKPVIEHQPPTLTPAEIGKYLSWGTDIDKWLGDLKKYALDMALSGNEVTGWKAVEGRSTREWSDQEAAFKALTEAAFPASLLYETVTRSLATIEKDVGKKSFNELVGEYVVKKPGKATLVPATDKRQAITNVTKATDVFKEE